MVNVTCIASELFCSMLRHLVSFLKTFFFKAITDSLPLSLISNILAIPVAARCKAWCYGRSNSGNAGSNSAEGRISVCVRGLCC